MAGRDDAEACGGGVAGRRGVRALRRAARYALVGLAITVAGVLVAAPFEEDPLLPHIWATQKRAGAFVIDPARWGPDWEGPKSVGISGTYVPSSPDDVGMPRALESLLLAREEGQYRVWLSGVPFRSVCGWHVQAGALAGGGPTADQWHGVVRVPIVPPHGVVFIPFRPLWLGLLGNVAAYGLAAVLLVQTFRGWRRAYRRENGRCIGCGYELAGLAACPECGREAVAAGA